jgi:hypothetical protein
MENRSLLFLHGYLRTWICHWRAVALMDWVLSTLWLIVDRPLLFLAHTCALIFLVFALVLVFMPYFYVFLTDVDSLLCER